MPLSYLFFGTPGFCVRVLDDLIASGRRPTAVVCQPDRPKGRGQRLEAPPTKLWALRQAIDVRQPGRCREGDFLAGCESCRPDLGVVFAFGQMLPASLLQIPRLGFINIHPSLLPRYRGAAPIQWTLINGDAQTGVSILRVTPRWDDGDILLQESTPVRPDENAVELGDRLAEIGGRLIVRAFELLEADRATFTPQDESRVVWAPALKKEDGQIDWSQPAVAIHNRIRGVQPWPGAATTLEAQVLKIHRTRPNAQEFGGARPGEIVRAEGGELWVATGQGSIELLQLQLEGKKSMDVSAFLRGRPIAPGQVLRSAPSAEGSREG